MLYRSIRGFNDILPDECAVRQKIESAARRIFELAGYREIRTPLLEETALFVKSVGEETDIVTKEMFSFVDRGDRNVSLRPEGTAPIVRSYVENNIFKTEPFQKLYYIGPMYRSERPQAGRLREFYQIGLEAIGTGNPAVDAEVISTLARLLDAVGLAGYEVRLNNLGCAEDKKRLSASLKKELSEKALAVLCPDCKNRLGKNPLRVLDCKIETCRLAVREVFKDLEFICDGCGLGFEKTRSFLDGVGVKYKIDPYIVRGLDYYTGTVFEVTVSSLGAQNAIAAGGRYDDLVCEMGGPKTGACGFAIGLDRVVMALGYDKNTPPKPAGSNVFIAAIGDAAHKKAFKLADDLRSAGVSCDIDYGSRSLKSQMRSAGDSGAQFVIIIGDDEIARGEATLRDMSTKEQSAVVFDKLVNAVKDRINGKG